MHVYTFFLLLDFYKKNNSLSSAQLNSTCFLCVPQILFFFSFSYKSMFWSLKGLAEFVKQVVAVKVEELFECKVVNKKKESILWLKSSENGELIHHTLFQCFSFSHFLFSINIKKIQLCQYFFIPFSSCSWCYCSNVSFKVQTSLIQSKVKTYFILFPSKWFSL